MNQQEEMRIAIAEACGWKFHPAPIGGASINPWEMPRGGYSSKCPDYLNDLNAMREAEMTLNADLPYEYGENLRVIAKCVGPRGEEFPLNGFGVFDIATLTAAQRSEAFCRTLKIGPFKESLLGGPHEVTTPKPEPVESLSGAPSVTHTRGEESAESPAVS